MRSTSSPTVAPLRPRKRFGQHFLTDSNILQKIVRAAALEQGALVLEIGPGQGHLTRALLQAGARVVAVELDRDLAARLMTQAETQPALTVLQGDILAAPPTEWLTRAGVDGADYKVVANLPYYITSAILRHLLQAAHPPTLLVVLVQREVAQQIVAAPGAMSLLAVGVQFYGYPEIVGVVPAGAFYPRPKVDSAIVRVHVARPPHLAEVDPACFFEIVRAGFGGRRKQLHNALARGLKLAPAAATAGLLRAGIDPQRRAETLSLDEWRHVYVQLRETRI